MKTPEEKARELYQKYAISTKINNEKGIPIYHNLIVKKCALIAVDEIVNCDSFFKSLEDTKEFTKYWYAVQQEINKL